jgi:hypothetical protein
MFMAYWDLEILYTDVLIHLGYIKEYVLLVKMQQATDSTKQQTLI